MECIHCKGTEFIKAKPIIVDNEYSSHISRIPVVPYICITCGHTELIVPDEEIRKQKKFQKDERRGV